MFEVTHAVQSIRRAEGMTPGELRLLTYLVEETLAGRGAELHQKTIAVDVFGRNILTFDPRADSIVRTTAGNLRSSLAAYYAGPGQADSVRIELTPGTYVPTFSSTAPLSTHAMTLLWSARSSMESRTVSGYRSAIKKLDAVLAESCSCSIALALKAEALASQAIHGEPPRPNLELARQLAARALDQPRPAWQAWLANAIVLQALEWKWVAAEQCYRKALELSGGTAAMNVWYTAFLVGRGRAKEAAGHLQRAVDLFGSDNSTCMGDLSMMLILARDYSSAEAAIQAALVAAPGYYQHHLHHAILLEAQGNPAGALRVLNHTPLRLLERPVTWGLRGFFAGRNGAPEVALRRISWLRAIDKAGRYIPQSQTAACWIGAGNQDEAVRSLERAAEERDPITVLFWAYPMTRHLKGHQGFTRLMEQIGLVCY